VLGGVLLVGAYAKLLDPGAFAEQIRAEGLGFFGWSLPLAWIGVAAETALGILLVLGVRSRWVLWTCAALVLLFLGITGRAYWRELRGLPALAASCGCFGNLVERTPAQAFWQDALLLVPALAMAFLGRPGARAQTWRVAAGAAGGLLGLVGSVASPSLPLDDLATRLRAGAAVQELCAGAAANRACLADVVPPIATGRHWVVLADLSAASFAARDTPLLNALLDRPEGQSLLVLATATLDEQRDFFWRAGPSFEIHDVPQALLRTLYRTLPRSFLVENGEVLETRPGLPPGA